LQDLSQPKSEVSIPEGLLAVPLLRHQRIALSWMVQKESSSLYCSGRILADDHRLGKTVSTIALILKERPPLLTGGTNDDVLLQNGRVKEESNICEDKSSKYPVKSTNLIKQARGLFVCYESGLGATSYGGIGGRVYPSIGSHGALVSEVYIKLVYDVIV